LNCLSKIEEEKSPPKNRDSDFGGLLHTKKKRKVRQRQSPLKPLSGLKAKKKKKEMNLKKNFFAFILINKLNHQAH